MSCLHCLAPGLACINMHVTHQASCSMRPAALLDIMHQPPAGPVASHILTAISRQKLRLTLEHHDSATFYTEVNPGQSRGSPPGTAGRRVQTRVPHTQPRPAQ